MQNEPYTSNVSVPDGTRLRPLLGKNAHEKPGILGWVQYAPFTAGCLEKVQGSQNRGAERAEALASPISPLGGLFRDILPAVCKWWSGNWLTNYWYIGSSRIDAFRQAVAPFPASRFFHC